MMLSTRSQNKRPLQELDGNQQAGNARKIAKHDISINGSDSRYKAKKPATLKRTDDGKENEAANAWYETLTVKELLAEAKSRGITSSFGPNANQIVIINELKKADRSGNELNEYNRAQQHYDFDGFESRWNREHAERQQRKEEIIQEAKDKGFRGPALRDEIGDVDELVWAETSYKRAMAKGDFGSMELYLDHLARGRQMCRLLGLDRDGSKAEVSDRIRTWIEAEKKRNEKYIAAQKASVLSSSGAGRRALEILTWMEKIHATPDVDNTHPDLHAITRSISRDALKQCEERAIAVAEQEIDRLAQELVSEDRVPESGIIGARLVDTVLGKWLEWGERPGYVTFAVGELRELLRLRGFKDEKVERTKKYIVRMLEADDARSRVKKISETDAELIVID